MPHLGVNFCRRICAAGALVVLSAGCGLVPSQGDQVDRSWYIARCVPHQPRLAAGARPVGPEDLTLDSRGVLYVSSNDHRIFRAGSARRAGAIYRYDVAGDGAVTQMQIVSESNRLPSYFETNFFPHGISLLEQGGQKRLFVINHRVSPRAVSADEAELARLLKLGPREVSHSLVEIFRIEGTGDAEKLIHEATVEDRDALARGPEPRGGRGFFLRDLAAVGPRQFLATNTPGGLIRTLDLALRNPVHSVVYFNGDSYAVALDRVPSADGIALARDNRVLYLASSQSGELVAYGTSLNPPGGEQPKTVALKETGPRVALGGHLDNIEWVDDRRREMLVAGHPNLAALGLAFATPAAKAPSRVFRLAVGDDGALVPKSAKLIYANDGNQVSAASVAAHYRDKDGKGARLIVGSILDSMFLVCRLDAL